MLFVFGGSNFFTITLSRLVKLFKFFMKISKLLIGDLIRIINMRDKGNDVPDIILRLRCLSTQLHDKFVVKLVCRKLIPVANMLEEIGCHLFT